VGIVLSRVRLARLRRMLNRALSDRPRSTSATRQLRGGRNGDPGAIRTRDSKGKVRASRVVLRGKRVHPRRLPPFEATKNRSHVLGRPRLPAPRVRALFIQCSSDLPCAPALLPVPNDPLQCCLLLRMQRQLRAIALPVLGASIAPRRGMPGDHSKAITRSVRRLPLPSVDERPATSLDLGNEWPPTGLEPVLDRRKSLEKKGSDS
jgi:hypothetical protein